MGNALVTPAPPQLGSYVVSVLGNTKVTPVLESGNPVVAMDLSKWIAYVSINADYTT